MALYAVDVRDGVIQRVTEEYSAVDNQRFFLIEAGSAKQAWAKANRSSAGIGSAECDCCRHRFCDVCEECSVAKQYSDYWICHGWWGIKPACSKLAFNGGVSWIGKKLS
jgi:hypothetical protein